MLLSAKRKRADVDMTEGDIFRHLFNFALPLLFGNMFQMLYNMVDTWVVGRFVSDSAFSAVGTLASVTNLMIGFFLGLSSGAGVVISKFYGAHNYKSVKDAVGTSAVITLVLSIVFTIAGILLIPVFLSILDMPTEEVEREARTYLVIWFSGISGLMVYNMGAGIMRAVGDSRRPFIMLIISALLNTVLDLLFVLVFDMGVEGVAAATVIAQAVSALLVVILLFKTDSAVKINRGELKIDKKILGLIIKIGIPTALQMSITSFSNMFVQSYINFFGDACMGGWTAYTKIDQIVILPMQTLAIATTTFVGQNLGCGQVKRAKKGANVAFLMCLTSTVVLIIPLMIFAEFFVSVFNENPDIISYGARFLCTLTPFYLFWCVNQVYAGALRGAGKTASTMVIMLSSFVAFRQIYLFVISRIANEILYISMCFPIGWMIAALATVLYYSVFGLRDKSSRVLEARGGVTNEEQTANG